MSQFLPPYLQPNKAYIRDGDGRQEFFFIYKAVLAVQRTTKNMQWT